jgi:hypothetical protein
LSANAGKKGRSAILKIRIIPFLIFISILVPYVVNAEQIKFEDEGFGLSISKDAPLEVQKQEAFVAAFFEGLSKIAEKIADFKKTRIFKDIIIKQNNVVIHDKIFSAFREKISEFDVDSQTIVVNLEMKDYIVNVDYKNQKFIVKELKLISPPIEFADFPKWINPPKTISGINIKDLKYEWDNKDKAWFCTVMLSYLYDTAKITKETKKKVEAKTLDFEFQKDNSNTYIFDTVVINGSAYGGGADSPDTIRKKALDDALRNSVEKVNGVFIQSLTEVENARLTKDQIMSQTLGIANVISKKFDSRFTSEGNFEIVCTVTAKVPIVRIVVK